MAFLGTSQDEVSMVVKDPPEKLCHKCGRFMPVSEFYINRKTRDGLQAYCCDCMRMGARLWYEENREQDPEKVSATNRKKKYGLLPDQYQQTLEIQNGLCAICGESRKLNVDHDHKTGKVRGLLCQTCNLLVNKNINTDILRSAIKYLNLHEEEECQT